MNRRAVLGIFFIALMVLGGFVAHCGVAGIGLELDKTYDETEDWESKIDARGLEYLENVTEETVVYVEVYILNPEEVTWYDIDPDTNRTVGFNVGYRATDEQVEELMKIPHEYPFDACKSRCPSDVYVDGKVKIKYLEAIAKLPFVSHIRAGPKVIDCREGKFCTGVALPWRWKIYPSDLGYLLMTADTVVYVEAYVSNPKEAVEYDIDFSTNETVAICLVYQATDEQVEEFLKIPHESFYKSKFDPCVCMEVEKRYVETIAKLPFVYSIRVMPTTGYYTGMGVSGGRPIMSYIRLLCMIPLAIMILDLFRRSRLRRREPQIGKKLS